MEVLMKLKCTPNAPSALKAVDPKRQLHQHPPIAHTRQDIISPSPAWTGRGLDCCRSGCNLFNGTPSCCSGYEATPPCCSAGMGYSLTPIPRSASRSVASIPRPQSCGSDVPLSLVVGTAEEGSQPRSAAASTKEFEYEEPEENFVSIDDAKVKSLLMQIGREKVARELLSRDKASRAPVVYEIIDLDDEEEQERLKQIRNHTRSTPSSEHRTLPLFNRRYPEQMKSPDISLIPRRHSPCAIRSQSGSRSRSRSPNQSPNRGPLRQRVIAQIDLLDSSDSETDNEGEEELPLVAAAVSCELSCDDDDDEEDEESSLNVALASEDERPVPAFEREAHGRHAYECYLCGKSVLSSYNLRRHMMIHTGERPFGCDMCDRRFREFSDLKKHRRRHAKEEHFVCMICHLNRPSESDPTRCESCCAKNEMVSPSPSGHAAIPEATPTTPAPTTPMTPPSITKKPLSRQQTPAQSPPPLIRGGSPRAVLVHSPPSTPTPAPKSLATPASPSPPPPPPLVPYPSNPSPDRTQSLLDQIPAVHRPSFHQNGMVTRREYPCPLCQRPFGTRHNLKRHFMIHTGEKPFNCSKCRKPFREYSTLKKHMVTHQRDRWYKCLRCPQKFRDFLLYTEHKASHPIEDLNGSTGSRRKLRGRTRHNTRVDQRSRSASRSGCEENSYDSNEDGSMVSEDWLECCECGQRFNEIEIYSEHLKEHDLSMQLFECYICQKVFSESGKLIQHITQHADEGSDSDTDDQNHQPQHRQA